MTSSATSSLGVLTGLSAIGMVFLLVVLGLRHARQKQEQDHAERMRALELGVPLATQHAWPAAVCIAIGAVMPVCALLMALIASAVVGRSPQSQPAEALLGLDESHTAFLAMVWGTSSMVGLSGVIAGAVLAWRLLSRKPRRDFDAFPDHATAKPAFDPDAFDTVGRRG